MDRNDWNFTKILILWSSFHWSNQFVWIIGFLNSQSRTDSLEDIISRSKSPLEDVQHTGVSRCTASMCSTMFVLTRELLPQHTQIQVPSWDFCMLDWMKFSTSKILFYHLLFMLWCQLSINSSIVVSIFVTSQGISSLADFGTDITRISRCF